MLIDGNGFYYQSMRIDLWMHQNLSNRYQYHRMDDSGFHNDRMKSIISATGSKADYSQAVAGNEWRFPGPRWINVLGIFVNNIYGYKLLTIL